jgi:hypothetical protein
MARTENIRGLGTGFAGINVVQETTNGMEPSRSAGLASRENHDYQRATGPVYPSIIQYRRISPPDPQVFAGLELSAVECSKRP